MYMDQIHTFDRNFVLKKKTAITAKKNKDDDSSSFYALAKYSNIGYYLISPLIIGVFIGLLVDSYFGSKPVATLIAVAVGTIAVFYNLYKLTKNNASH